MTPRRGGKTALALDMLGRLPFHVIQPRPDEFHRLQQLVHERNIFAPIWQLAFISGIGRNVGQSGFGLIKGFPYTAPYEDLALKDWA